VQDGRYRLPAAWHLRDARNLLPTSNRSGLRSNCSAFGSEETPIEELASVRRTNGTYSFPVSGFHERAFVICSEGMSETRLISLNCDAPPCLADVGCPASGLVLVARSQNQRLTPLPTRTSPPQQKPSDWDPLLLQLH
jgi:hypothetical protein